jgi:hypothetical protein
MLQSVKTLLLCIGSSNLLCFFVCNPCFNVTYKNNQYLGIYYRVDMLPPIYRIQYSFYIYLSVQQSAVNLIFDKKKCFFCLLIHLMHQVGIYVGLSKESCTIYFLTLDLFHQVICRMVLEPGERDRKKVVSLIQQIK